MKKLILGLGLLFLLCGCTNVKDLTIADTVQTLKAYDHKANIYRTGYKYYLPRGMSVADSTLFNEILTNSKETYYLYIDAVSYNKKIKKNYEVCSSCYYSVALSYDDKFGYIEINNQENNKYLIEIMYNYAKIEVIVDKDKINDALLTSISILKSVTYNDEIVANLFGSDVLNFTEEEFNIFNTTSSDSTYLQTDGYYEEEDEEVLPDTDLLN